MYLLSVANNTALNILREDDFGSGDRESFDSLFEPAPL